jgi:hypothetical protein
VREAAAAWAEIAKDLGAMFEARQSAADNGADPESSAEAMKAKHAALEVMDEARRADPPQHQKGRKVKCTSSKARRFFTTASFSVPI